MNHTQAAPGQIRVERVRDREEGGFDEDIRAQHIHPPIRTDDELKAIKDTVNSLSPWDRVEITFGQAFGPVDEVNGVNTQTDADTVVNGKTVEAIVDDVNLYTPENNKVRDDWDIELLLLRGTDDDEWDLRSTTGIGGDEEPWHIYTYPYNRDTDECQPENVVTSGWLLDIEKL